MTLTARLVGMAFCVQLTHQQSQSYAAQHILTATAHHGLNNRRDTAQRSNAHGTQRSTWMKWL